jgi:hypothetical protein
MTNIFSINYYVNIAECKVTASFINSVDAFDNFLNTTPLII